jgi:hypothetical protein
MRVKEHSRTIATALKNVLGRIPPSPPIQNPAVRRLFCWRRGVSKLLCSREGFEDPADIFSSLGEEKIAGCTESVRFESLPLRDGTKTKSWENPSRITEQKFILGLIPPLSASKCFAYTVLQPRLTFLSLVNRMLHLAWVDVRTGKPNKNSS